MDYKDALSTLTMSSKTTKMLGVGLAAIAFLLVTIPVFHTGVLYADSGDNDGDQGDHDNNCDHGDHDNNCDHGDHDNDNHDSDNE